MTARCPYCKAKLDPAPKRKVACPECGKPMYVRQGRLLVEFDALREDWLNYLRPLRIVSKDFDEARKRLTKQFGREPAFYDVVWRILNNVVAAGRSYDDVETAYREMARVASFEHKDSRQYLAQAMTTSLQALKARGVKRVVIHAYADQVDYSTCEACRSLVGTRLSADEALAALPVPSRCTNEHGCRCTYEPG